MGSPWPALLLFFIANLVENLATGSTVSIMSMVELGVMVISLVAYVGLVGASGTDALGVQAAIINAARTVAISLFVAAVIAIVVTNYLAFDNPLIAFADIAIGGFAVFGAISAAKPGAT